MIRRASCIIVIAIIIILAVVNGRPILNQQVDDG
jgi:hypothetical protein